MGTEDRADNGPWNSLEVAKLLASLATPVILLFLGYQLDRSSEKRAQQNAQAAELRARQDTQFERVTAKRMELWTEIGPQINDIYSYLMYVGRWKSLDAADLVERKRSLDALVYMNKPIFSDEFFGAYSRFMDASFQTMNGWREDAKPRTTMLQRTGEDRNAVSGTANEEQVYQAYFDLLEIAGKDFDLTMQRPTKRPDTPQAEQPENSQR